MYGCLNFNHISTGDISDDRRDAVLSIGTSLIISKPQNARKWDGKTKHDTPNFLQKYASK